MWKKDIEKKIAELEREKRAVTGHGYHQDQYRKLLQEKIDSYKRILPEARNPRVLSLLEEALATRPNMMIKTKGDARKEKRGRYINNI